MKCWPKEAHLAQVSKDYLPRLWSFHCVLKALPTVLSSLDHISALALSELLKRWLSQALKTLTFPFDMDWRLIGAHVSFTDSATKFLSPPSAPTATSLRDEDLTSRSLIYLVLSSLPYYIIILYLYYTIIIIMHLANHTLLIFIPKLKWEKKHKDCQYLKKTAPRLKGKVLKSSQFFHNDVMLMQCSI